MSKFVVDQNHQNSEAEGAVPAAAKKETRRMPQVSWNFGDSGLCCFTNCFDSRFFFIGNG